MSNVTIQWQDFSDHDEDRLDGFVHSPYFEVVVKEIESLKYEIMEEAMSESTEAHINKIDALSRLIRRFENRRLPNA